MRYARCASTLLIAPPLLAGSVRVYQTNSAGDQVHVIDPVTNKVVQTIQGIEVPYGVTFAPDGTRAYITFEAEKTVWATDTKTGKVVAKVPLSGHPNNLSIFERRTTLVFRDRGGAWRGGCDRYVGVEEYQEYS